MAPFDVPTSLVRYFHKKKIFSNCEQRKKLNPDLYSDVSLNPYKLIWIRNPALKYGDSLIYKLKNKKDIRLPCFFK